MGSKRSKLKIAQEQKEDVEFPNQCLGKYNNGEKCETMLPRGRHLCKKCQEKFDSASKMECQSSFNGGAHRRLEKVLLTL